MAKESVNSVKKVLFGIKRTSRVRNIDFRDVYLNPYIFFVSVSKKGSIIKIDQYQIIF